MLVLSLAPVLGTVGVLGIALAACIVGLLVVSDRRVKRYDGDPDARLLTLKLRHPWKYRAALVTKALSGE